MEHTSSKIGGGFKGNNDQNTKANHRKEKLLIKSKQQ